MLRLVFMLIMVVVCALPARAQNIPATVDPGRIRNELDRRTLPHTPAPQLDSASPITQAPAGADKIEFTLKAIKVSGATSVPEDDLKKIYAHLLNKKITLAQIYDIANAITKLYHDRGYILSRAIVPQQEIEHGVVTLKIVEGFINRYEIRGANPGIKKAVSRLADKIIAAKTLTAHDLERYLLLMNDLPGVRVRSVLSPSEKKPGGADMTLLVEQDNVSGIVSTDNNGNSFLGPVRGTISTQLNGVFQSTDQINIAYLTAPVHDELRYYNIVLRRAFGDEGTMVGVNKSHTVTSPDLPDALGGNLGTNGESSGVTFDIVHPVIRSRRANMNATAAFDILKNKTNYDPAFSALETEDNQRVVRLGLDMNVLDNFSGYNTLRLGLDQGVDIFSGSKKGDGNLTRPEANPVFTKLMVEASRLQRLYGPFTLFLGATAQHATDPLLASEEFGFGGPNFGRGFDPSEITGDSGYGAKFELAYSRSVGQGLVNDYQLFTFYDVGTVWNRDPGAGEDTRESAASAGFGARFNTTHAVRGDFFIAKPLTNESPSRGELDKRDWQFKFSLTKNF